MPENTDVGPPPVMPRTYPGVGGTPGPVAEPERELLPPVGEVDNAWRTGRKFKVAAEILVDGWTFKPSFTYTAEAFGRAHEVNTRRLIALTTQGRTTLLGIISWADTPSRITPELKHLIDKEPGSPYVRGFVREEIGIVPAKKDTPITSQGWIDFINAQPLYKKQKKGLAEVVPATFVEEPTILMRIRAQRRVDGTTEWTRMDTAEHDIDIPERVLLEGRDAVYDWILDNEDFDWEDGDEECGERHIENNSGPELIDHNLSSVIRSYEAAHPGVRIPN